jgi:hypothetical protein
MLPDLRRNGHIKVLSGIFWVVSMVACWRWRIANYDPSRETGWGLESALDAQTTESVMERGRNHTTS